jgi:3-mercaptopyruvate sulfurtransferase SseA
VAQELRQAGWINARALIGGWNAWQDAGLPVEPKAVPDTQKIPSQ